MLLLLLLPLVATAAPLLPLLTVTSGNAVLVRRAARARCAATHPPPAPRPAGL